MDSLFRDWFRDKLREKRLLRDDVARHLGVSYRSVHFWYMGERSPERAETFLGLADLFGIPVEEVLRAAAQGQWRG